MQKNFIQRSLFFFTLLLTTGCGWHVHNREAVTSLSIPFAEGDENGCLTGFLTEEIEKGGHFRCDNSEGAYTLKVRIADEKHENVGFRYDPEKHENSKIIPNETRTKMLAEVSLVNNTTGKVVLGPKHILATYEYDHQNYSMNNAVNKFSLGQLSDIDTSKAALNTPKFRALAKEIAQFLAAQNLEKQ